jgi:hypothetical protein
VTRQSRQLINARSDMQRCCDLSDIVSGKCGGVGVHCVL